jgi:hypothetical protein
MVKSNTATILVAMVATLLFGFVTWWAVDAAGGTKVEPGSSNTPNATVSGPPAFK